MNQYHRFLLVTGLTWCVALGAAFGQGTVNSPERPRPISAQLKMAAVLRQADQDLIQSTVAANVQLLLNDNYVVQQDARRSLEIDSRAPATPSQAFVNCYSEALTSALESAKIGSASIRARLNAAIALTRVAEALGSRRLEPAVLLFLDEKQPYVVRLWGVRAAKYVLPDLVKAKASKKLTDAVVAAFKEHLTGAMAAETYASLEVADRDIIDVLLAALDYRTQLYRKGLPQDPSSEAIPFRFLVVQGTAWHLLTPEQRQKVMQSICNVLVYGAYHHDRQAMGTSKREQLYYLVDNVLQTLAVAAQRIRDETLERAAMDSLRNIRIAGASMSQLVDPVVAAITRASIGRSVTVPKLDPPPSTNPVTSAD